MITFVETGISTDGHTMHDPSSLQGNRYSIHGCFTEIVLRLQLAAFAGVGRRPYSVMPLGCSVANANALEPEYDDPRFLIGEAIVGMRVGGLRKLIVPPNRGYGSAGVPGLVPPNTTLVFDVELIGVE